MQIHVSFEHKKYTDQELCESIEKILNANNTLALSTSKEDGGYINTAHYGFSEDLVLFLITAADTEHSKNAATRPHVGIAIWNRPTQWGTNLEGLQLFGDYQLVTGDEIVKGHASYAENIPAFKESFKTPEDFIKAGLTFYKITVRTIKLLDEPKFGRRNYIELRVTR